MQSLGFAVLFSVPWRFVSPLFVVRGPNFGYHKDVGMQNSLCIDHGSLFLGKSEGFQFEVVVKRCAYAMEP